MAEGWENYFNHFNSMLSKKKSFTAMKFVMQKQSRSLKRRVSSLNNECCMFVNKSFMQFTSIVCANSP